MQDVFERKQPNKEQVQKQNWPPRGFCSPGQNRLSLSTQRMKVAHRDVKKANVACKILLVLLVNYSSKCY